jgi:lactate dehydrogenase-like 2-hydroxyacid dehydrogenase
VPAATAAALAQHFEVLVPDDPEDLDRLVVDHGQRIRGIATAGKARLDRALLQRLPALEIVACYSAGLDNIDTDALAERGIALTNSSVALADEVADLAITPIVMARRRLVAADAHIRSGAWAASAFLLRRSVRGERLGVLGLGYIASGIARRADAMGMHPRYCTRRPVRSALTLVIRMPTRSPTTATFLSSPVRAERATVPSQCGRSGDDGAGKYPRQYRPRGNH